jgi:hypothetical protein
MPAKIRSKLSKSGPFLRLAYSAPLPQDRRAHGPRTCEFLAAKGLPFVKLRANDQPTWRPESFWHVRSTGAWERDVEIGRKYARLAIAAMKSDQNSALISLIIQDIVRDSIEQAAKTGRRRHTPMALGFLGEVSQVVADSLGVRNSLQT